VEEDEDLEEEDAVQEAEAEVEEVDSSAMKDLQRRL
jgi:hypothetical protein